MRHKDENWNLREEGTPTSRGAKSYSNATIQLALLMDIRDELKRLNEVLYCHNTLQIPHTLKRIDKRLAKRMPLK